MMVSTHERKQGKNCKNLKAIRLEKRKRCEKYLRELLAKKSKRYSFTYKKVPEEHEDDFPESDQHFPSSAWQDYLNCFYEESETEGTPSKKRDKSKNHGKYNSIFKFDDTEAKERYNQYKLFALDGADSCKVKDEPKEEEEIKVYEPIHLEAIRVKEEVSDLDLSDTEINGLITTMKLIDESDGKEDEEESDPIIEADTAFNFKHSKRKKFEYRSYLDPFEVKFILDEKTIEPKNSGRANLRSNDHAKETGTDDYLVNYYKKNRRKKNLGPRHFQCSMCGSRFISKGNLKAHCDVVHSIERNYECSDCGMKFKTKYHLKTHCLRLHRKIKPFTSSSDGTPKEQSRYPKRDRAPKQFDKSGLICSVCNVILNNRRLLNMHMLVAHTRKQTKKSANQGSKVENGKSKRISSRKTYNLRDTSENVREPCKRIIRAPPSFSEEIKIFECNDCSAFYSSKCLLKNHILETHLGFHCENPECRLVFKKKGFLQRHKRLVHSKVNSTKNKPLKKKPLKNKSVKNKSFKNKTSKTKIKKTKAPKKKLAKNNQNTARSLKPKKLSSSSVNLKYECDYCKERFAYKSFLAQHILRKHLGKEEQSSNSAIAKLNKRKLGRPFDLTLSGRKFVCNSCSASFKTRSHLQAHTLQRHSEVRKFNCKVCHAQFKMKGILKTHMIRVHDTHKF